MVSVQVPLTHNKKMHPGEGMGNLNSCLNLPYRSIPAIMSAPAGIRSDFSSFFMGMLCLFFLITEGKYSVFVFIFQTLNCLFFLLPFRG